MVLESYDRIYSDEDLINFYKTARDKYYIQELYHRNKSLLSKLAWKYSHVNSLYDYNDLQSEGYIALVKAVETYCPDKETTFKTYLFKIANNHLYQVVNGSASKDKSNKILNDCVSIYKIIGDKDDECMLIDTLEDEVAQEMIDNLPEIMFIADLRRVEEEEISKLSPKQKLVVEAVNGFNSALYSQAELSRELGISTTAVNNHLQEAYRRLRDNNKLRSIWYEEFKMDRQIAGSLG